MPAIRLVFETSSVTDRSNFESVKMMRALDDCGSPDVRSTSPDAVARLLSMTTVAQHGKLPP